MKHPELKEQATFIRWCREQGHMVCGIGQGLWTNSWNQIAERRKGGLVKGFPDVAIIIHGKYRNSSLPKLVFVEMKAQKGKASPDQIKWVHSLGFCEGVAAKICYGADDAIEFIKLFYEKIPPIDNSFIDNL